MLDDAVLRQCALDLYNAERSQTIIPPLSKTYPEMTLPDAYAIQAYWYFHEPDFGTLLDSMLFADGATIPAGRFRKPRLEVELSFVMGADLRGGHVQIYDVLRATEFIQPALEIIDYRTEVPRQIVDIIADNTASGDMVLAGSFTRPITIQAGDVVHADYGELGGIGVRFA